MIHTLDDALSYIHSRTRFGSQKSLVRIRTLLSLLGNPQDSLRFVHVAGTNGKGSVSTMTARILTESGYRTGLYTSPFLVDFRERFRIDGAMMEKDALILHTVRVKEAADRLECEQGLSCTEFEIVTAIAFCWFLAQHCDIVVLEVGLGGKLDSTNVIKTPLCAVIAPVSMDHTAILGETIAEIAAEKAGIIKEDGDVVLSAGQLPEAVKVIEETCRLKKGRLHPVDTAALCNVTITPDGTLFTYRGTPYRTAMLGAHQAENSACVLEIVNILQKKGFSLPDDAVQKGLSLAKINGRLDVIAKNPVIVVDGAHNAAAADVLQNALVLFDRHPRVAVMAVMQDKDWHTVIQQIASSCDAVVCCEVPDMPRTAKAHDICLAARSVCTQCETASSVKEAMERAKNIAGTDGTVLVCGSLYLAGIVCGKYGDE